MSWETDYNPTSLTLDLDTLKAAALTAAELCPREHLAETLDMLGLTTPPPKPRKRDRTWRDDILHLHRKGMQPTAIARSLGISRGAVWHHLHAHGIEADR